MDIELPSMISVETIQRARPAVTVLRQRLTEGALPTGLTVEAVDALLAIVDGVTEAAMGDNTDLSPSEAADQLGMARPSVIRLIARGELSARKEGGHYVVSPRELRSFRARMASVRREALSDLSQLVDEFGF